MSPVVKNILKAVLFFGIGFTILYIVFQNYNKAYIEQCELNGIPASECDLIDKVVTDFANSNFLWIGVVVLMFLVSNIHRAIRWKMLLKPLGYHNVSFWNSLGAIHAGYLANLGLPRLGEVMRPVLLSRYEGAEFEKVLGTVAAARVIDVLCLLVVVVLALIFEYDIIWGYFFEGLDLKAKLIDSHIIWVMLAIVLIGILGLRYLIVHRARFRENKFFTKVEQMVIGFWNGLLAVSKVEKPFWFIFHTIGVWLMYFLMTYLCFFAYEPTSHLGPSVGLVALVFGTLGMLIPSPGGMGTYHFLITEALQIYALSFDDAFSFANIIFFSIQLFGVIFFGILAFLLLPIYNKKKA